MRTKIQINKMMAGTPLPMSTIANVLCNPGSTFSSSTFVFFRFYLCRVQFQKCVIPVPDPDEGMLNHLMKPQPPCFHTGAEGPGIDGVPLVPDLGNDNQATPHRDRASKDPYDQSASSGHEPETDCLREMRYPAGPGIGGNLRESCHHESQSPECPHPKRPMDHNPPDEDWNDEHQVGRQPIVVRIGSPSTNETISPRSSTQTQNPPEQSLTTRGCPKPLPRQSAGKVRCACDYVARTWPSRRREPAPQAFSTLRNCRPDRSQKGLYTTPNRQTQAAVGQSGFESMDLFSQPRQGTVLRQARKRTRTLGSERASERNSKT